MNNRNLSIIILILVYNDIYDFMDLLTVDNNSFNYYASITIPMNYYLSLTIPIDYYLLVHKDYYESLPVYINA